MISTKILVKKIKTFNGKKNIVGKERFLLKFECCS